MSTTEVAKSAASRPRTIAVTGVTGFIGRHVLAELAKHPVEVVAITRRPIDVLTPEPRVRFVQFDLGSAGADAFELLGKPDALIHLAWGGLPNYNSLHHFEQELPGHYRFLKEMVSSGLDSLFVAGTCFEYGMRSGPLNENMEALPANPYGFAKDALRRQLEFLKVGRPFSLSWGRLFYLYGEGQPPNSLWPQLRKAIERGDSQFNMSGGEQLRDYLPVGDAAKCIVELTLRAKDTGIINICSGKPVAVRSLVESWIGEMKAPITPNFGFYPYPEYEPMAFWGDRQKLDRWQEAL